MSVSNTGSVGPAPGENLLLKSKRVLAPKGAKFMSEGDRPQRVIEISSLSTTPNNKLALAAFCAVVNKCPLLSFDTESSLGSKTIVLLLLGNVEGDVVIVHLANLKRDQKAKTFNSVLPQCLLELLLSPSVEKLCSMGATESESNLDLEFWLQNLPHLRYSGTSPSV